MSNLSFLVKTIYGRYKSVTKIFKLDISNYSLVANGDFIIDHFFTTLQPGGIRSQGP
jgi:hypothetical protein